MSHNQHCPTVDELVALPEVRDARIVPGGHAVAYIVRVPDWERNVYVTQLWYVETDHPQPQQLTCKTQNCSQPRWSPDGHWLSFLAQSTNGDPKLCLIDPTNSALHHLTTLPTNSHGFAWSPDGRFIAYLAPDTEDDDLQGRRERYGEVHVVGQHRSPDKLWLLHVANAASHPLHTSKALHIVDFDWHPDGTRIAFTACPTVDADDWDQSRVYVITLESGASVPLTDISTCRPKWSPDGTQLAFSRWGTPSYVASNQLGVLYLQDGHTYALTPFDGETRLLDWGPAGLYLLALKGATSHMFLVDPENGSAIQLTPDDPPGFAITEGWIGQGCTFSKDFSHATFVSYDITHAAEVTLLDTTEKTTRQLTSATSATRDWGLGHPQLFRWTSPDGVPVEGILTKPPQFSPRQRHPLVVVLHGGPTYTSFLSSLSDGDHWYCTIPQLVSWGALILQPNYRGSTGYGNAFRALNVGTLGLSEQLDITSGMDALIAQRWVNREKIGAIGMSHGGYLAAFLATYTQRLRTAVMLSGISDWALNYYSTDTGGWMRQYLHATPWEDPDIYRVTSPLTYLSQAKTPVLIQHGAHDDRAPITNAYALYRGLRENNVETKLVVYPNMGHGISKPREMRHLMEENLTWFRRWLWGDQMSLT